MVEARHRILVHGLLDELLGLARRRGLARHAELDGGIAVERSRLEQQRERQVRAVGGRATTLIDPPCPLTAPQATSAPLRRPGCRPRRCPSAERRAALSGSGCRKGLPTPDSRRRGCPPARARSRRRSRHERLELPLVLVRGEQRLVQRALEPEGAQLALGDAAQALGLAERHEICAPASSASAMSVSSAALLTTTSGTVPAACCLILAISRIGAGRLSGKKHRSSGEWSSMRAGERVDLRDPMAAHGMAAIAQRAVDELDVVFATAQHDQRYRGLRHACMIRVARGAV